MIKSLFGCDICSSSMEIHTKTSGIIKAEPLCNQSTNNATQYITHATTSHTRIAPLALVKCFRRSD